MSDDFILWHIFCVMDRFSTEGPDLPPWCSVLSRTTRSYPAGEVVAEEVATRETRGDFHHWKRRLPPAAPQGTMVEALLRFLEI
eukprot:15454263-Alexandrium_andersonii.AAC.1